MEQLTLVDKDLSAAPMLGPTGSFPSTIYTMHIAYYTQWPQIISKLKLSDCKELLLDKSHLPQWRSSLVNESRIGFCESSLAIRHQQTPSIHLLYCGHHQVLVITIKLIIVGNIVVTDQTTYANTSLVIRCHLMIIIT